MSTNRNPCQLSKRRWLSMLVFAARMITAWCLTSITHYCVGCGMLCPSWENAVHGGLLRLFTRACWTPRTDRYSAPISHMHSFLTVKAVLCRSIRSSPQTPSTVVGVTDTLYFAPLQSCPSLHLECLVCSSLWIYISYFKGADRLRLLDYS
jgi:hypothetical protein